MRSALGEILMSAMLQACIIMVAMLQAARLQSMHAMGLEAHGTAIACAFVLLFLVHVAAMLQSRLIQAAGHWQQYGGVAQASTCDTWIRPGRCAHH